MKVRCAVSSSFSLNLELSVNADAIMRTTAVTRRESCLHIPLNHVRLPLTPIQGGGGQGLRGRWGAGEVEDGEL